MNIKCGDTVSGGDDGHPRPRRRLAAALALLCAAALLAVVHLAQPVNRGLWFQTFYDSIHAAVFAGIALCCLLAARWSGVQSITHRVLLAGLAVFVLALLSEAAQIPGPRDASLSDLLMDWLGGGAVILLAIAASRPRARPVSRLAFALAGALCLAIAAYPLARVSAAYAARNAGFPELLPFGTPMLSTFVRAQNARVEYEPSDTGLYRRIRVQLGDGSWPGIVLHDLVSDWSDYETLRLEIGTPDAPPFELNIRVHDEPHLDGDQPYSDRFSQRFQIEAGARAMSIPLQRIATAPSGRRMDMRRIDGIVIFAERRFAGREFVLNSIRLE